MKKTVILYAVMILCSIGLQKQALADCRDAEATEIYCGIARADRVNYKKADGVFGGIKAGQCTDIFAANWCDINNKGCNDNWKTEASKFCKNHPPYTGNGSAHFTTIHTSGDASRWENFEYRP